MHYYNLASGLTPDAWFNLAQLIIGVPSVIVFIFTLTSRIKEVSPRIAFHEFDLLIRQPWHIVLVVLVVIPAAYLVVSPVKQFPATLLILLPIVCCVLLLISFFLAQSRRLSSAVILAEIRRLSKKTHSQHRGVCTAIRFDIDRLKAIANYFPLVGQRVQTAIEEIIREEVDRLHKRGVAIVLLSIPGEDETVVVAGGLQLNEAADFADEVRRRVKRAISEIPDYNDAVELVANTMAPPTTTEEEREGIGTVSAGVAADRGSAEDLLSDVSAAVKESKTRGRNKTVIYRPGRPPQIRSDYASPPKAQRSEN